mgnify:FL=1
MKEYGSSVQKLVNYILTIADEEQRTKYAYLMVEVMKQIHPNMKDNSQDYSKKLWDDLYIMSQPPLNIEIDDEIFMPNPLMLVASKNHIFAKKKNIDLALLKNEKFTQ